MSENVIPFKTKSDLAAEAYDAYCAIIRDTPATTMTFELAKTAAQHWHRFLTLYHEVEADKIDRMMLAPHLQSGVRSER